MFLTFVLPFSLFQYILPSVCDGVTHRSEVLRVSPLPEQNSNSIKWHWRLSTPYPISLFPRPTIPSTTLSSTSFHFTFSCCSTTWEAS
jgi:hypothetical protein